MRRGGAFSAAGRKSVRKRTWILLVLAGLLGFPACKKSEGTKIKNYFGSPPQVSEFSISKIRVSYNCAHSEGLCDATCSPDGVTRYAVSIDLVTASVKVVDPTAPTQINPSDILVVVLRFLDPPPSSAAASTQVNQFSLEMFDNGPTVLGTENLGTIDNPFTVNIVSGDTTANDGVFTRVFYFGTTTTAQTGTCLEESDKTARGGITYSQFSSSTDIPPSSNVEFPFTVQGVDREGNLDSSATINFAIQGTFRDSVFQSGVPCGAPKSTDPRCYPICGNQCPNIATMCGCLPPPP
jgi:hypothetical protein